MDHRARAILPAIEPQKVSANKHSNNEYKYYKKQVFSNAFSFHIFLPEGRLGPSFCPLT
jgi:hypothetical protein